MALPDWSLVKQPLTICTELLENLESEVDNWRKDINADSVGNPSLFT